jgi:hypothetical protein
LISGTAFALEYAAGDTDTVTAAAATTTAVASVVGVLTPPPPPLSPPRLRLLVLDSPFTGVDTLLAEGLSGVRGMGFLPGPVLAGTVCAVWYTHQLRLHLHLHLYLVHMPHATRHAPDALTALTETRLSCSVLPCISRLFAGSKKAAGRGRGGCV